MLMARATDPKLEAAVFSDVKTASLAFWYAYLKKKQSHTCRLQGSEIR